MAWRDCPMAGFCVDIWWHGQAVDKMNLSRSDVLFQANGECKARLGCKKGWHRLAETDFVGGSEHICMCVFVENLGTHIKHNTLSACLISIWIARIRSSWLILAYVKKRFRTSIVPCASQSKDVFPDQWSLGDFIRVLWGAGWWWTTTGEGHRQLRPRCTWSQSLP